MNSVGSRRAGRLLVVLGLMAALVVPATRADAAFTTPSLVRSISGTGRAALFPWGMAYNPVSDEIIVTDYLNYQVRRFDTSGHHLGDLPQPTGADGDAESVLASVAIDPRNGDIYIGKPKPDTLAHYSADGTRLADVVVDPGSGSQTYTAWLTIDADGYIYVLDSHLWNTAADPSRLIKLAPGGTSQVAVWDLAFANQGPGATQAYGIGVNSATGRIYYSDSINRRVQMLNPDGTYRGSFGFAGDDTTVGALSGDLRSVLVDDAAGRVYVVDALQSQIEVYTLEGAPLFHFGSQGEGPGQFIGNRGITFDDQHRLWVAEYGNYRLQAFDADGNALFTAPQPTPSPPPGQLGQPRDLAVDPATGDVWVADTWNERFQRFAADGTVLGTWGQRGNNPPYGVKYPRGIGFDPVNRRVWVSNNANGTIYVYDDQANFLFQIGSETTRDNSQAGFFDKPQGITFGSGGRAYVTDGGNIGNSSPRVKILDAATGAEQGTIARNAKNVATDDVTGDVFVADSAQNKIYVYGPAGGTAIRSFGGKGSTDGKFNGLWGITVANGVVYASDNATARIQAFTPTGTFQGKWGGYGSDPYKFKNPSGMGHDAAGRLYVTDAQNDRVVVYDPAVPKPAYEFSRPTLTLTGPANGSWTDAPVTVTGTATDNKGVANIEVAVRDPGSGLWWEPLTGTWKATQSWALAPVVGTSTTSVSFAWTFPGAQYDRAYHVEVRARDTNNTLSTPVRTSDFNVKRTVVDTAAPETTIDAPTDGSVLPAGAPVQVAGDASDDLGVASVGVALQHTATGQWWTGTGWSTTETWLGAAVTSPGAPTSAWSYTWTPPAASSYTVSARATDFGPNSDATPASSAFSVALGGPDTGAPDATLAGVTNNQMVPVAPLALSGVATDNLAPADVQVMFKNRDTSQYWKASTGTWVTAFTWNAGATLATPGASPTAWAHSVPIAAAGNYAVSVRAIDAAGNIDTTRPWVNFSAG